MDALDILHGRPGRENECWEWEGRYVKNIPKVFYERKYQQVARVSYRMHVGNLRKGYHVWRTCSNSRCFNPNHLMAGTARQHGKWEKEQGDKIYQGNSHKERQTVDLEAYFRNLQSRQGLDGTDVVRYYGDMMRFDRFVTVWKMNREAFNYEIVGDSDVEEEE